MRRVRQHFINPIFISDFATENQQIEKSQPISKLFNIQYYIFIIPIGYNEKYAICYYREN